MAKYPDPSTRASFVEIWPTSLTWWINERVSLASYQSKVTLKVVKQLNPCSTLVYGSTILSSNPGRVLQISNLNYKDPAKVQVLQIWVTDEAWTWLDIGQVLFLRVHGLLLTETDVSWFSVSVCFDSVITVKVPIKAQAHTIESWLTIAKVVDPITVRGDSVVMVFLVILATSKLTLKLEETLK